MNKTNLWVDLSIFTAFLIGMDPQATGFPIHEWLSLALVAATIAHLLLHWKWITSVGVAFFKKLFHNSRLKFALDIFLFIAFTSLMMSGIMVSRSILPLMGIQPPESPIWEGIHSASASLSLIILGIHIALNWGWVVSMTRKYIFTPLRRSARSGRRPAVAPVEITAKNSRS